jgi:predicted aconitase with swiveling domain
MGETFEIAGRGVVKGCAKGEALVASATLSFWGEVDAVTGRVIAVGHPLEGECLSGRVLVIRSTKGSSGTPMVLRLMSLEGVAPAAMVNLEVDGLAALGCIVNGIPMMTGLERDPFGAIATGDHVVVDADRGTLTVEPRGQPGCEGASQQ